MRIVHTMGAPRAFWLAVGLVLVGFAAVGQAQHLVIGLDNKIDIDDAGKQVPRPPGKDAVLIVDIHSREAPRIVGTLPLMNSLLGPPTNLAITPDDHVALVANSVEWVEDGGTWKPAPDNKLFVIDLQASPPKLVETVTVGKQPSGMAINKAGTLVLIANRADSSVTVATITGTQVKVINTLTFPAGDEVAAVAMTPDAKHALVARYKAHKLAVLDIDGETVTYNKQDLPAGLLPYNVQITPAGHLAMVTTGTSDGHVDAMPVYDLTATPWRVSDWVVVGDGPEGLTISPTGKLAVPVLINGSAAAKNAWYYHKGALALLAIDGKKVTRVGEVEVGRLPEGVAFSPEGTYLYVANDLDDDLWTFKVEGTTLTRVGQPLKLPGHPASMRSSVP
jgi:DNA-binding beta-propeller fold protein YncE